MVAGARDSFITYEINGGGGAVKTTTPQSLSAFLTENKQDTNQNRKFPTSSPTASVFARLGFNFDPADDTILELSEEAKQHLRRMPRFLKDWQAEDMRNGNATDYYQNPMANITNSVINALDIVRTTIFLRTVESGPVGGGEEAYVPSTYNVYVTPLEEVYNEASFAVDEGRKFLSHTNRLSKVDEITPNTALYPHYDQAVGVGRVLQYICYQTDEILNTAPMLGSFTSLFVEQELTDYKNLIITYPTLISNSISTITETTFSGEDSYTTTVTSSNLSSNVITTIINNIRAVKILFQTRRTHDENFWDKAQEVLKEQQKFINMNNGGQFNDFMIKNVIGTDKLLESRNIADNPKEFEEQVIVSEDGMITVYNKTTGEIISDDNVLIDIIFTSDESDNIINTVFDQGQPPELNVNTIIVESVSPLLNLDQFIEIYNANVLTVTVDDNVLNVNTGAIIFDTENGVWSNDRIIIITNTNDNIYYFSDNITNANFLNSEVDVSLGNVNVFLPIQDIIIANTGSGYSNGNVVITNGGIDNIPALITVNVNSISGSITTANIISGGGYTSIPTLNVASLGGSNANLIAVLGAPTLALANGDSFDISVRLRSLTPNETTDYGYLSIKPGIQLRIKGISRIGNSGILLPSSISQNVGDSTNKVVINEFNGPYEILDSAATGLEKWTWRNLSQNSVTILSVVETTNTLSTNNNTHMNIQFYQANTPNTLNVNQSVLWYANVKPLVEFPNVSSFLVTTSDGQQRSITIGINPGNVNDSGLYNETLNSNPDIIVKNTPFDIRVFGGKPNTVFTYTSPSISGSGAILANGYALVVNTSITSNGSYTFIVDFAGTNHRRTLTKVITS